MNEHIWIPLYTNTAVITNTDIRNIVDYCLGDLVTVLSYNYKLNYKIYNHRTGSVMDLPSSYVTPMTRMIGEGK